MKYGISVAPMMDWTDRHCRYFLRLMSPRVRLYTEMVAAAALHHGDADRLLRFDPAERPLALQVGGNDPELMASAARLGGEAGYDEINVNVGCPSDRVRSGAFGACLMAEPGRVADCVAAMRSACDLPVTVKTRIGIDGHDEYDFLRRFVETVAAAGCDAFIVHARIAVLGGLSPKENRSVPPLKYDRVYRLKSEFPQSSVMINGGVTDVDGAREHLRHVDGVMIGRQAYHDPWFLAELDEALGGSRVRATRMEVVDAMRPYIAEQLADGAQLKHITRHMLGLFAGQPGARAWRRYLSRHAFRPDAGLEVLDAALEQLPSAA